MKQVYIIRHCKAAGQLAHEPLTELGVEQAQLLADFLEERGIERIVSSPFVRACDSVRPLAERLGLPIETDERLAERILSTDGDLPDWMEQLRLTFEDLDLSLQGGETSRAVMQRAATLLAEIIAYEGAGRTAIASHGNLITLLLKHFDDRFGFEEWKQLSNPDVFLLTFETEQPTIERIWVSS
ncbi:histidine phosphatase family protein [Brevibacillus dissolubilis]|uniref:histidine phosphatase family protein n=1 Tax=Brevibacillus dissolubilis TaxID=1844116 RepID=UPI0011166E20|nr:histidine phosphatase family protein [Brevibacillus dissolubilis]